MQLGLDLASEIGLSSRFCSLENTHQIVKVALSSSGKITFAQYLQWEIELSRHFVVESDLLDSLDHLLPAFSLQIVLDHQVD